MKIKNVGILYHPRVEITRKKANEVIGFIKQQGINAWICSAWEKEKIRDLLKGTDLVLTVGGDGTILRAVQSVTPEATPVTGINLGKLGFLTELDADETTAKLPRLLSGKGWLEERAMLQVELKAKGKKPRVFHALNDAVIGRGGIARIIRIEAAVDGQILTTYRADAVIVATATGSTGYALAAGGPVMRPQSRDFLMMPVAPHLCFTHPLVLEENSEVVLTLNTYHAATLSIDGHINTPLSDGDRLFLRRSPNIARFYRIRPRDCFYQNLEDKLKGKQGDSDRKS